MASTTRPVTRIAPIIALLAAVAAALLLAGPHDAHAQGQPPPGPFVYSGMITIADQPAPDGLLLVARMTDVRGTPYETPPVATSRGRYNLTVGPPDQFFINQPIAFFLLPVPGTITAAAPAQGHPAITSVIYTGGPYVDANFTLQFPALPPLPTPTPEPTATPVPTPTPEPTPVPTATPEPTPTPVPTATPEPTPTPEPTATPVPTPTPEPTATPVPTAVPAAPPTPTPEPEEEGAGTCGQSGATDLYVLVAGVGLLGLLWRRRNRGALG